MVSQSKLPILIYDGDCEICCEWINYWKKLTGENISYRPYQDVHENYPDIPLENFEKAIQFVDIDESIKSGAAATFSIYKNVQAHSFLDWFYHHLPGFSLLSELFYNFFSQHRGLLSFFTHLFWGRNREPASYQLTTQIFLRLLGCIYLAAFVSFAVQILGLIGSEGVLPLELYLPQLKQHYGTSAYWQTPMLFWFYLSDKFLLLSCITGAFFSVLLIFNLFQRFALVLLYLLYLSLFYAGQTFMAFQWDLLLLEAGFLAIFLLSGSRLVVWLYRWLIFRFMLLGGLVKIISQDPNWDGLTALNFHFETQPLPTLFAWYAHHLPDILLMTGVAITLFIELVLPFLIFFPRRFRLLAAFCFILFQSLIILTGNYNFFNLLTIFICLFLFDDAAIKSCLPFSVITRLENHSQYKFRKTFAYAFIPVAAVLLISSAEQMNILLQANRQSSLSLISTVISPWHIVQNYGPFAVMTTVRHEIIIEGSNDGNNWLEYHFKYKPGDVSQAPKWVTPHQPRLDWQMWFAALSQPENNPWFDNLLYRLLSNSEPVKKLFAHNPFPETAPKLIRARYYEYNFTSPSEKKIDRNWWTRKLIAEYSSAVRLSQMVN
jgi:predicted DCC family thiol-disulfide oxidoreductase YuxK